MQIKNSSKINRNVDIMKMTLNELKNDRLWPKTFNSLFTRAKCLDQKVSELQSSADFLPRPLIAERQQQINKNWEKLLMAGS
jgi:hypothetical protein